MESHVLFRAINRVSVYSSYHTKVGIEKVFSREHVESRATGISIDNNDNDLRPPFP